MAFKIHIHPKAYTDIQKAVDYCNEQQKGLGEKFYKTIFKSFETLKANPYYKLDMIILVVTIQIHFPF